jgi:hypothetical protein
MKNKFISNVINWYFSKGALPYWCILAIDTLITIGSLLLGYLIMEGSNAFLDRGWGMLIPVGMFAIFYIIGFRLFHTYNGIIRYSSFSDLSRIVSAVLFGAVLSCACAWILPQFTSISFPVTAVLIGSAFGLGLIWLIRIFVKLLYDERARYSQKCEKAFIYGTREGGIAIAKGIRSRANAPYWIAGFVSDDPQMRGTRLMGCKVFLNNSRLVSTMKSLGINTFIVSPMKNDLLRKNDEMVNSLIEGDIKIMMMPLEQEWDGHSEINFNNLHKINVEALLPRDKIEVDMEAIGNLLRGKRILITGAAGSIGSEMVRQIAPYKPSELILVDQAETPLHDIRLMMARNWPAIHSHTIVGDIANQKRMTELFAMFKPEYVFHAAAYKHVPMMEDNPSESIENNVNGTKIIADLSVKYGTKKFVMISTDKAVNPTNVMGCSKRICEIYVHSLDKAIKEGKIEGQTQFVTTRFGNVLGSNGSVIPLFEKQISEGGPVTVTDPNIIRFFMLIPEACKLVLEAGTMGHGGEIFVFDMGKPVKIVDLARRMIKMSGAKDIEIKFTGLRDGEKLYEEVLNDKEVTLPTFHEKIKIAKVREYDYNDVNRSISDLIALAIGADDMTIVKGMKEIVPEFKSQHSKYEVLDKKEA